MQEIPVFGPFAMSSLYDQVPVNRHLDYETKLQFSMHWLGFSSVLRDRSHSLDSPIGLQVAAKM